MHRSVATIDSPEFVNLQPLDINPLMSACDIKVMYVGENRNRSFISKEVAMDMAKSLRGCPIVGYYKEDKGDFADHGQKMTIDDEGVKFECMTKPYGFVAPDSKVWFQKFEDYDEFGNSTVHEYLMTQGYLWTEQFPEAKGALEGRPQSMELDESTLSGHWSENIKENIEFFIINDAIFSKLCILGEDVEPCFEGSSVTASQYTMDENFTQTLFSMMQDMQKFALKGGQQQMEDVKNIIDTGVEFTEDVETEEIVETEIVEEVTEEVIEEVVEEETTAEFTEEVEETETVEEEVVEEVVETEEPSEFKKEEDEEEDEKKTKDDEEDFACKDDGEKEKYELLKEQFESLENQYAELKAERDTLFAFKQDIENAKKDELINSFYMLSDEDKADVIENKAHYSYDEIESKLSVICVRKKVNFSQEEVKENKVSMTFSIEETEEPVPAWISALQNTQKNNSEL